MRSNLLLLFLLTHALLYQSISCLVDQPKDHVDLSKQLASMITYPDVMADKNGIVIVQFSLTDGTSIGRVKVFSKNQALNTELVRQLTGKKLAIPDRTPLDVYTVKLIFRKD